jgi:hypothetical protein
MSAYRRDRSQFDSASDKQRVQMRERAKTMAEQGLDRPESIRPMPDRGEPHKPGNTGGTYNSSNPHGPTRGSTDPNTGGGVELLARVIGNQTRRVPAPAPMAKSESSRSPLFPAGARRTESSQPWRPKAKGSSQSTA